MNAMFAGTLGYVSGKDLVNTYIEQTSADNMKEFIQPLKDANIDLADLTQHILVAAQGNIEELGASANDYLHVFGYTAMAFVWAKMAESSLAQSSSSDEFYQSKIKTARYYFARLLPRRLSLIASIKAGCDTLFDMDENLF